MARTWKKGRLTAVIILIVLCFLSFGACSHFSSRQRGDPSLSTIWFQESNDSGHTVTGKINYFGWPIFRSFVPSTLYVFIVYPDGTQHILDLRKIMYNHKDNQYHLEWEEDGFSLNLQCAGFDPITYHFKWDEFQTVESPLPGWEYKIPGEYDAE